MNQSDVNKLAQDSTQQLRIWTLVLKIESDVPVTMPLHSPLVLSELEQLGMNKITQESQQQQVG